MPPQIPDKKQPSNPKLPPEPKQAPVQPEAEPKTPMPKEKPNKVKQSKDETLKYTMTYANGGFNNGVELKPGRKGNIELSIAIYGGGEQKSMKISKVNPEIDKLINAYVIGAESEQETDEITKALKGYFQKVNQTLSMKIINILQDADSKIKDAIKQTFKEVK